MPRLRTLPRLSQGLNSNLAFSSNAGSVTADGFGYAKVNELELPLHHQEVGRLEV